MRIGARRRFGRRNYSVLSLGRSTLRRTPYTIVDLLPGRRCVDRIADEPKVIGDEPVVGDPPFLQYASPVGAEADDTR